MLLGKYYRIKYKIIEFVFYTFYISFFNSIRVFFWKRQDYKNNGNSNRFNKLPWMLEEDKNFVVIVDDTVPRDDLSAGGKTLINYINIYQKLGYKVKFLPDDFLKREPYTTNLENKGVEVLYGKWWKKNYTNWLYKNKDKISFVMLNAPRSIKYIDFFKKCIKTKVLYYDMDIYFVREKLRYDVTKEKKYLRESKYHKIIEKNLFNLSDAVLTISEKENKFIKQFINKDNVFTIPCYVYNNYLNINYTAESRNNLLFVGGDWETANLDGIKWFIEKIFPVIYKKNNSIKLIIVGLYNGNFIKGYQTDNIRFTGKISDERLKELYLSSKIALAPLRFGAGVKGKVVEAMYYGVPIVSTDFGVEGLIPGFEDFITISNTEQDFANSILNLYDDKISLEKFSALSLTYSKKYFSFEPASKSIIDILKK